jgi:hypothetical protein
LYFRVSAYNSYGEGAKSNIVTKTILGATTYSLDGIWGFFDSSSISTISGSTGVYTSFDPFNSLEQSAVSKNFIKAGGQSFRNLIKTGDRTWTGQKLFYRFNTSSPNVCTSVVWTNFTITMSDDGQSFQLATSNFTDTWTRG